MDIDKIIKHFSTSIITGATADALASDENISWGLYANVSEDELTKTVAHALLLRPECLAVRTRREGDVMTTCPAASRRIVQRYNAGGELADYVDHFAWDAGFASSQLDTPDAVGFDLRLCTINFAFISSGKARFLCDSHGETSVGTYGPATRSISRRWRDAGRTPCTATTASRQTS